MKYEIEYYTIENGSMMCHDFFDCEPKDAARTAAELVREVDGCEYAIVSNENDDVFAIDERGNVF